MTIFIDVNLTADTSTLDLVFPNGIKKGGRVRLNLLRPPTGDASREAEAPQASNDSAAVSREAADLHGKAQVLGRGRVSPGADRCDIDSKLPCEAKSRLDGLVNSRNEPEDSDSEAVDAPSDYGGASPCPSSPGTTRSQDQETKREESGTAAIETRLRVQMQDPPRTRNLAPVPLSVDEQVLTAGPDSETAAKMLTPITALGLVPVASLKPTLVVQIAAPAQITATPTSSSGASGTTSNTALTETAVAIPPQEMRVRKGNLPGVRLVPVVLPEMVAKAERLPLESREAFIAAAAKVCFKCLECSHSTFSKAAALRHLSEHAVSRAAKPAESSDCEAEQPADNTVPETSSEPSPQASKATRSTKRTQRRLRSQRPEAADTSVTCFDQTQGKKKHQTRAAPKERVTKKMGGERLQCDECHRTFSSKSNLGTHKRTIHSSKTFACDLCPRVSKSQRRLRLHVINIHQKTAADSVCEHCNKRFVTVHKLQHHIAVMHLGDGACLVDGKNPFPSLTVYRCKECSHVTFSRYRSKAHAITHTGVMPFSCPQCDKTFVMRDVLNRHILLKHDKGREKQCPHCERRFISDGRYKSHIRFHERNAGFVCDQCGQLFESKAYLEQHMQRHSAGGESWSCHVCSLSFKSFRAKTIHISHMHPEASSSPSLAVLRSLRYPHSCGQCPVRFKTQVELHAHELCRHNPGSSAPTDRYKCSYCDKGFQFTFSLRAHLRTHTGERPFVCQHCDKTFSLQKTLQNHMVAMHTKDFKLHCLLCGKGCVNNTKLKQHLRKSHKAVLKPSLPAPLRNKGQGKPMAEKAMPKSGHQQVEGQAQQAYEAAAMACIQDQGFMEEQEVVTTVEATMVEEDPIKLLTSFF